MQRNEQVVVLTKAQAMRLLFRQDGLPRINGVSNQLAQIIGKETYAQLQKDALNAAVRGVSRSASSTESCSMPHTTFFKVAKVMKKS